MISIVVGTRAQLIKMAPVMRALTRVGAPYRLVLTGQHHETMDSLLAEFEITIKPDVLYSGPEVSGLFRAALWFPLVLVRLIRFLRQSLSGMTREKTCVVVHGDTFSTLMGAVAARLLGIPVVHVESGLRSFDLLHPFPEEITRLLVFRLTDIAFCPGEWAHGNMAAYRALSVNTQANTLLDALRFAQVSAAAGTGINVPSAYCVVSIHRFENIFNRTRFLQILDYIELASRQLQAIMVLHPATRRRLEDLGQIQRLQANPGITLMDRMTYLPFIKLLSGADYVITDGGSNQEELFYLGVPALLFRAATERKEGLTANVTVSGYDKSLIERYLHAPPARSSAEVLESQRQLQPSELIARQLLERFG